MTKFNSLLLITTLAAAVLASGCVRNKTPKQMKMVARDGANTENAEFGADAGWDDPFGSDSVSTFGSDGAPDEYHASHMGGSSMAEDGQIPEQLGGEELPEGKSVPELPEVFFGFDSSEIDSGALAQLDRNAGYLKKNQDLHVVLRGHTDEQGTEEYNIALGSRRAQSVRDYLVGQGINADRLHTMSFGENMPKLTGEDDASRSQNRRVEFFIFLVEDGQEVANAM